MAFGEKESISFLLHLYSPSSRLAAGLPTLFSSGSLDPKLLILRNSSA